ncbi:MAG: MOSC domain-containing protein [Solirubrobacterales bacterium]|nr:MOSC domain-containing protein [Solirubrobacterales bacterium]
MSGAPLTAEPTVSDLGSVVVLRRYPVKSMLGEDLAEAVLSTSGVRGDRVLALIDLETGRVASAKHPKSWRRLLQFSAWWDNGSIWITLPDETRIHAEDSAVDLRLSQLLGRRVHVAETRPDGATLARPAPEDVIAQGEDAEVPYELLEIGQGTSGTTFVDYAPVHLITSATLEHVAAEMVRYRPNVVVATPSVAPFAENDWVGREIMIGPVRLRGILPTPRCAIPTLQHGELPRATHAVRTLLAENRVDVPGFGVLPCLGLYAEVLEGGMIQLGDGALLR